MPNTSISSEVVLATGPNQVKQTNRVGNRQRRQNTERSIQECNRVPGIDEQEIGK